MAFSDPKLDERRRLVAQLIVHNTPTREITRVLQSQGWKTSQPTTVRDKQAIQVEWRRAYAADMADHVARELAKLDEVERVAWLQSPADLPIILRVIDQRCKLLGLYTYSAPAVDVEAELAGMGFDPATVLAQVEAFLGGSNPE